MSRAWCRLVEPSVSVGSHWECWVLCPVGPRPGVGCEREGEGLG